MNGGDSSRICGALEHCKVHARVGVCFLQLRRCLWLLLRRLGSILGLFLENHLITPSYLVNDLAFHDVESRTRRQAALATIK